ncbi:hypothetical protein LTR66_013422 [Elasticomyces elasticus]|nr:hypothetical protein LTR66_013422 [Elasticomyces elasticus]KAK4991012.1 hypothetical protein LTR50_002090 [Elasticomyces elasticus]
MRLSSTCTAASAALLGAQVVAGITLDLNSHDSIKSAASTVAHGMMKFYNGNVTGGIVGMLPGPYYWWESGAMWGSLIDYWYYTGDTTYNSFVTEGLLYQVGPNKDYMPPNQTKSEGNDDQGFWGLAAMSAAELKFPNPPDDKPQWLALAQAVFNSQAIRWDNSTCGGGLRWQIFTFNNGYNYKNTISNGCFFNMAARLGKYTGNQTYVDWAERMWDWVENVGLMSPGYAFYDGTDDTINCTQQNHIQWTYNAGVFLLGSATMWNITNSPVWYDRTWAIFNATSVFFSPTVANVMYEVACEPNGNCDIDQRSFKAYLARWMAASTKVAPFLTNAVMIKINASAAAAALQCSGGNDGTTCGLQWTKLGVWDGNTGVGEQMSAMEVIQSTLIQSVAGPVTNNTGGTSKGNYAAGTGGDTNPGAPTGVITTGDKAGAGILTAVILVGILGGAWWMVA